MSEIRNRTMLAVGLGLALSTAACSLPVDAAVGEPSTPSAHSAAETTSTNYRLASSGDRKDPRSDPRSDRRAGLMNFGGFTWALWSLGAVELWLAGWLSIWTVSLLVAPQWILDADGAMRRVVFWRNRSTGVATTFSHLTFVAVFAQHPRVMDVWVDRHAAAISDWLSIRFLESDDNERDLRIRIDDHAIAIADAPTFRAILPETPFCLAVRSEGRLWKDLVQNVVLRQAMHPVRAGRLMSHRTIPVMLDRNCLERAQAASPGAGKMPLWRKIVWNELGRIPGVAMNLDIRLLDGLVSSRRLLLIADEWNRMPVTIQNNLQAAVSCGDLPCLVVFDDQGEIAEMNGLIRARAVASSLVSSLTTGEQLDGDATAGQATLVASRPFDASAVPQLMLNLKDGVADVRLEAAHALGSLGVASTDTVQQLIRLLGDQVTGCRQAAADALGAIGPAAAVACESLASVSLTDHRMVRAAACRAMGAIGNSDAIVMTALSNALSDADPAVRSQAARSLGCLGMQWPDSVPALKMALLDESAEVRSRVVAAIAQIPDALTAMLTELVMLIADPAVNVRREVVTVLGKVDRTRDAVVTALAQSLSDPDSETRSRAAASLCCFGVEARTAIPQLAQAVRDTDSHVRRHAVSALDAIGFSNLEAVSALEEATRDSEDEIRETAKIALNRITRTLQAA
ncbi:MAG: HEAT repeat domain-containing protein [Planctomycetota bacterium]|nr:HEAT repeat domain-containing protein [Planctomycetota bacterium]MDA1166003.1 HEAT repeat domain-containing protein [Planctomycetota bacterium]